MLKKSVSKLLVLSLIFVLAFATSNVLAQDEIECGDVIEDEVDGDTLSFMLELDEGDAVIITLISDDFDAYLEVYDEDGDVVAEDDDSAGDLNSRLTLSEAGEYEIVVDSLGGDPEGEFELSVDCLGDCEAIEDELEDETLEVDIEAEEGDEFFISLESDEFDTLLNLLNEDGDVIASNDDGGSALNSLLVYEFEEDGDYVIEVTSFGGVGEGEFTLLICADTGDVEVDLEADLGISVVDIQCDSVTESEISDDEPIIFFTFDGEEGSEVTITMTGTSGDLDPYLGLFSLDALYEGDDVLAEDDDSAGDLNSEIVYELEEDTVYVIGATRYNFEDGTSEGEFELELSCD